MRSLAMVIPIAFLTLECKVHGALQGSTDEFLDNIVDKLFDAVSVCVNGQSKVPATFVKPAGLCYSPSHPILSIPQQIRSSLLEGMTPGRHRQRSCAVLATYATSVINPCPAYFGTKFSPWQSCKWRLSQRQNTPHAEPVQALPTPQPKRTHPVGYIGAAFNSLQGAAAFFEGRWTLTRSTREVPDGTLIAECTGEASLHPMKPHSWQPRVLKYAESGSLKFADNPSVLTKFEKTYLYVLQDESSEVPCMSEAWFESSPTKRLALHIYFGYGNIDNKNNDEELAPENLYLSFDLSEVRRGKSIRSTGHLCDKDWYFGYLRLEQSGDWELEYEVTGPEKNYVIKTKYQKLAS